MERHGCLIWRKHIAFCDNLLRYVVCHSFIQVDFTLCGFSIALCDFIVMLCALAITFVQLSLRYMGLLFAYAGLILPYLIFHYVCAFLLWTFYFVMSLWLTNAVYVGKACLRHVTTLRFANLSLRYVSLILRFITQPTIYNSMK